MYLSSISKIGDVILVENEDAIEDINVEIYSNLVNCEVITETGQPLGRVRGFTFNAQTGEIYSLIIASLGLPQIPDQVISTYELPIEEIVSSGPNRLIVFEGAEERINRLSVGLLERLGIGKAPWEREDEYYTPKLLRRQQYEPNRYSRLRRRGRLGRSIGKRLDYEDYSNDWELDDEDYSNDWDLDDEDYSNDWDLDDEDDKTGGSTPIPSPRRPGPRPGTNDSAELPPIEYKLPPFYY
jgi:sporulation protein YlmC with PRC-barrel domain